MIKDDLADILAAEATAAQTVADAENEAREIKKRASDYEEAQAVRSGEAIRTALSAALEQAKAEAEADAVKVLDLNNKTMTEKTAAADKRTTAAASYIVDDILAGVK